METNLFLQAFERLNAEWLHRFIQGAENSASKPSEALQWWMESSPLWQRVSSLHLFQVECYSVPPRLAPSSVQGPQFEHPCQTALLPLDTPASWEHCAVKLLLLSGIVLKHLIAICLPFFCVLFCRMRENSS